jgi:hypothetical protein
MNNKETRTKRIEAEAGARETNRSSRGSSCGEVTFEWHRFPEE